MNRCQRILASAVVLLLAALPLQAQTGTSLSGSVIDQSGAALPGATVTLSGPGGSKQQVSGSDGRFVFTNLTPGTYTLTAAVSGFGTVTQRDVAVAESPTELPAITMRIDRKSVV